MVYYGSEWGIKGEKKPGDHELRPAIERPEWNDLTSIIAAMADSHRTSPALCFGGISMRLLENKHCIFERDYKGDRVMVAVNLEDCEYRAHFNADAGRARDLITGEWHDFGGGLIMEPHCAYFLHVED